MVPSTVGNVFLTLDNLFRRQLASGNAMNNKKCPSTMLVLSILIESGPEWHPIRNEGKLMTCLLIDVLFICDLLLKTCKTQDSEGRNIAKSSTIHVLPYYPR